MDAKMLPELSLKKSEIRYRRLFEAAQDGVLILDATTGLIEDVNPYLIDMLGYSREEFIKKKLWEVGAFRDIEASKESFEALQEKEFIRYDDLPLKTKDGRLVQVEFVSNVYMVGNEKVIQCNIRNITDRKHAEAAQPESEERYRLLMETLPDGVIVHSQGKVVFANQASATIIGANNLADLIGKAVIEFVHPDYREMALERVQQSLKDGIPIPMADEKYVRLDGTVIDVEVSATPFSYAGKPAILTVFKDITKRKLSEQVLQESEIRFRNLADNSPDVIYVTELVEHRMLFFNREEFCGYSRQELNTSPSILTAVHPDEQSAFSKHWKILLAGDPTQVNAIEYRLKRKDGEWEWIQSRETILERDPHEKPTQMLVTLTLISERKRAEAELMESKILVETVLENIPSMVFLKEAKDLRFVLFNRAGEELLGYDREAVIGKNDLDLFPPEQATQSITKDREALDGKTDILDIPEEPIQTARKGQRLLHTQKVNIRGKDGTTKYLLGISEDITERKAVEKRIQLQLHHLSALSAIDRLISSNFDLTLSLSEILKHVSMELGMDAADILILDPFSHLLEFRAGHGFRTEAVKKTQIQLGASYAGQAALERKLVKIRDLREQPDNILLTTLLKGEDFVCYYCVPLIAKGQVKGVLEVYHRALFEPDAEWVDFLHSLAGQAVIAIDNSTLFDNLQSSNLILTLAYDDTLEGWSRALDLRSKETEGHTQRVTEMTVTLARSFGLTESELKFVRWGALLHDIGKMGIPDKILLKPGVLTDSEWVKMKKHPTYAYDLLAPIRYLRPALDIPYCHHEKWDGSGYPRGYSGTQIPLIARIFAVVDVWDALLSDRPYRPAWSGEKVREYIRTASGTHFDPRVVDAFKQIPNLFKASPSKGEKNFPVNG